jgi:hypothetical protein
VFSAIIPLWGMFDLIYYQCSRLQLITIGEGNVFRVRLTKYQGNPLVLENGETIQSGDLLLKIHLYNYHLMNQMRGMDTEIRRALYVYQQVEDSLPGLACYLASHERSQDIKGVVGVTVLNRGINKLGFNTFPIINPWYRYWKESYMIPMYCLCHGTFSNNKIKRLEAKYVVMSKNSLFDRYLPQ